MRRTTAARKRRGSRWTTSRARWEGPASSRSSTRPWPRFDVKSYVRSVNYETASLREDAVRQRTDASPRGGGVPAMGEARQIFAVSGEHTWNVAGETITPAPVALAERQFQL